MLAILLSTTRSTNPFVGSYNFRLYFLHKCNTRRRYVPGGCAQCTFYPRYKNLISKSQNIRIAHTIPSSWTISTQMGHDWR
ncbi:hypothetical protein GDO78_010889 [Eleutherodactylus coqui]|uniref:Uncharacterized protein n=1 Tax=Eleutherodactylus coqui TaxID=57060 RepID=A0A8J6K7E2_ELECQ|nr:hypothetical protein GDO78_010889 [Eleutherodactylus coqui]